MSFMPSADDLNQQMGSDDFEFDSSGQDPDAFRKGGMVELEGCYHLEIAEIKADLNRVNNSGEARYPNVNLHCRVLHSVDGQSPEGALIFHNLIVGSNDGSPCPDWAKDNMLGWLAFTGVFKTVVQNGVKMSVDAATGSGKYNVQTLMRMKGCQFVATVEKRKDKKNPGEFRIQLADRKCFHVHDPAVAHVPKNAAALKMVPPLDGVQAPPAGQQVQGQGQGQQAPVQNAPQQNQAPAAQQGGGIWGNAANL